MAGCLRFAPAQPLEFWARMNLGRWPRLVWKGQLARNTKPEIAEYVPNHFPPGSGSVKLRGEDVSSSIFIGDGASLLLIIAQATLTDNAASITYLFLPLEKNSGHSF